MDHLLHVGDLGLDHLTGSDRLAEGDAVVSALEGDFEHALSHTKVGHGDVHAGNGQGVDGDLHALALFAEQVLRLEHQVGEFQARMAGAAAAHHVGHGDDLEARSVVGHQEAGQAGVLVVIGVGHGDDVGVIGAVGVADQPLLAVQDVVAVGVLDGGGVQVGARAAGLLGDGEVAVHRLVLELVHQLCLDLVGAVVVKDAPVHVGSVMQVHAHAARAAGELFLDAQDLKLVKIPSAVLAGQVEAIQVVFLGQLVELLGEGVGDLDLLLNLLERTFGKLADLLQIRFELLVGDLGIGIHVNLLRLCPPICAHVFAQVGCIGFRHNRLCGPVLGKSNSASQTIRAKSFAKRIMADTLAKSLPKYSISPGDWLNVGQKNSAPAAFSEAAGAQDGRCCRNAI